MKNTKNPVPTAWYKVFNIAKEKPRSFGAFFIPFLTIYNNLQDCMPLFSDSRPKSLAMTEPFAFSNIKKRHALAKIFPCIKLCRTYNQHCAACMSMDL